MSLVYYFAYGSNLHPLRLQQRVPSARLVGTAALKRYRLSFAKRGRDASGKAHIEPSTDTDIVHGAVFQLATTQRNALDEFEGPGYGHVSIDLEVNQQILNCYAYVGLADHLDTSLQPFHWYKELILMGTRFHGFPHDYIQTIERIPTIEDTDPHRRRVHHRLIADMANFLPTEDL